jgi:hypothetical protein
MIDIVILPKRKPDGCLDTLSCLECARKSGIYCLRHNRPHLGFEDGSTACVLCVEEAVEEADTEEICKVLKDNLLDCTPKFNNFWLNLRRCSVC